ncbi:unnamed protein product, partial [Ectocarpus sp. 4 AP-2014]
VVAKTICPNSSIPRAHIMAILCLHHRKHKTPISSSISSSKSWISFGRQRDLSILAGKRQGGCLGRRNSVCSLQERFHQIGAAMLNIARPQSCRNRLEHPPRRSHAVSRKRFRGSYLAQRTTVVKVKGGMKLISVPVEHAVCTSTV